MVKQKAVGLIQEEGRIKATKCFIVVQGINVGPLEMEKGFLEKVY